MYVDRQKAPTNAQGLLKQIGEMKKNHRAEVLRMKNTIKSLQKHLDVNKEDKKAREELKEAQVRICIIWMHACRSAKTP